MARQKLLETVHVINGKRNEVPVHVGAYQNDRASQVTLARHLQNLCRIVAEQQRSVGKMDAGIAFIEAGQNVRGFIQSNNRQFHIWRNGGKVDFTGLLATCQNGADAHNEAMVEAPGVITGRYGTIGEVFFAETSFWPLNTTLYVENFHENDEKFVYYFLKTLEWKKFASASAVPGINRNTVHKEIVRFPDFETQQKIASVLSTIDKKIAVNKAINDNLAA